MKGITRLVAASAVAACATVLGTACGGDERSSEPATAPPPTTSAPVTSTSAAADEVVVDLAPIGGAGPAGEIRLSVQGGVSQIVVEIGDAEGFVPDVHPGSCLRLGNGPSYFLPPVQAGRSEALLAAPLEKLLDGAHAVHLHAPAGDPVACAELPSG